ncbi:MAG TPA: hypothetical protein VJT31_13610, partial [Rugosimonospora sp.]|nr:hypothetical protein [Rugosimonospora sp.]
MPAATGVARWNLLATALAGRAVHVEPGDGPPWTDGRTIHLDPGTGRDDQLAAVAVQASLIAAGSLAPDVMAALVPRPVLGRRYLAVEGHRALAANRDLLPRVARGLLDESVALAAGSASGSLRLARSRRAGADPPGVFG